MNLTFLYLKDLIFYFIDMIGGMVAWNIQRISLPHQELSEVKILT